MTTMHQRMPPAPKIYCRDSFGGLHPSVVRVAECTCELAHYDWAYVQRNKADIDRNWAQAGKSNPAFFDGIVLLTSSYRLIWSTPPGHLEMTLFATRFRNYLHWRHDGFRDSDAIDGFGSGIIRSADGAVLLIRQQPGNVNEGMYYFPSGFIDNSDVDAQGRVDIAASIAREVKEETGLAPADLVRVPGFIVTRAGPHLSVGVEFQSPLPTDGLAARIERFLADECDPEVAEVSFIADERECDGMKLTSYCDVLLPALL
jgi:8-oxo-dGTP pyrophosphatase MutT (NUDIX family)